MVFIFIFHKILNYKVFFSFLVLLWPRTSTYFLSRRTRVSFQDLHVWIIKIIHFPTIENPTVSTEQNPNLLIEETTFFFFFLLPCEMLSVDFPRIEMHKYPAAIRLQTGQWICQIISIELAEFQMQDLMQSEHSQWKYF